PPAQPQPPEASAESAEFTETACAEISSASPPHAPPQQPPPQPPEVGAGRLPWSSHAYEMALRMDSTPWAPETPYFWSRTKVGTAVMPIWVARAMSVRTP